MTGPSGGTHSVTANPAPRYTTGYVNTRNGLPVTRNDMAYYTYSPSAHTYVYRTTYFYSGWGGYYGCAWCFTGPYAYGPWGMPGWSPVAANYYPPAPIGMGGALLLIALFVFLFFVFWRMAKDDSGGYSYSRRSTWP